MCLNRLTGKPKKKSGYGYVVRKMPEYGGIYNLFYDTHKSQKIGEEQKASTAQLLWSNEGPHYKSGFHIFKRRCDAVAYSRTGEVIFRVKYSSATQCGRQAGKAVVVAGILTLERRV